MDQTSHSAGDAFESGGIAIAGKDAGRPEHARLMDEYIAARCISSEIADAAGLSAVADARAEFGPGFAALPALVIPYHTLDGEPDWVEVEDEQVQFWRLRYLRERSAKNFVKRKPLRFQQRKDSGVHVYLPPLFHWRDIAADPSVCIVLTEGECKALSLAQRGIAAVGLGGVDCIWRRIDENHHEFHPVLASFKWGGRDTAIVFDSDIANKPNVLAAEERLIKELTRRGAVARPVRLPKGGRS